MKNTALTAFGGFVIAALIGCVSPVAQPPSPISITAGGATAATSTATDRATTPMTIADTATINRRITVAVDRPPPPGLPPWTVVLATMPEPPRAPDGQTPPPIIPAAALGR